MDATILVMSVRRTFGNDEQVALVRYSQCSFESSKDHVIDIGIWVGMFIDQQSLGSRLIGAGQREMT